jgi:4-amino-4-deoxy-L-arabinose transferase-like glycosyltransferase
MRRLRRLHFIDFIAIAIFLIGAFLRLYRIDETMIFQADQGRDAMVVERILDGDIVLLGPVTSVGNMYLGPFYYYFMAPFLALTSPDPVGPAIGVAVLNILGLLLLYIWTAKRFDRVTALFSVLLLTTNVVANDLSRFSWNPNIGIVFALCVYICVVEAVVRKKYWWFVVATLAFGILTQSHYMFLLMGGLILTGIGYALAVDKENRLKLLGYTLISFIVYLITWLPLVVFDVKHGHIISSGFTTYLSEQSVKLPILEKMVVSVREMQGKSFRILAQLNQSPNGVVDRAIVYGTVVLSLFLAVTKKLQTTKLPQTFLLYAWIIIGIAGVSIYPDTVYDHYLAFILPATALLFGLLLSSVWRFGVYGKALVGLILMLYLSVNLTKQPAFMPSGPTASKYQHETMQILQAVPLGKYNIALISEIKDWRGLNYRYFLSESPRPPANVEDYDGLNSLVIVDELRVEDPFTYEIYEIQTPKLTHVEEVLEIPDGPRIYIVTAGEVD